MSFENIVLRVWYTISASLVRMRTKAQRIALLDRLTGGLSYPAKMPCPSYSLPASACKTGSVLRRVAGSICSVCYAFGRGCYLFPSTVRAMARRMDTVRTIADGKTESIVWSCAIALRILLDSKTKGYFRWHDSGDIQSVSHLRAIMLACKLTPGVRHWLPTKERGMLRSVGSSEKPANLLTRVSLPMIGQTPRSGGNLSTAQPAHTSGVIRTGPRIENLWMVEDTPADWIACDAWRRDGNCGDCRGCWLDEISFVAYPQH